jgi:hypothetical protein
MNSNCLVSCSMPSPFWTAASTKAAQIRYHGKTRTELLKRAAHFGQRHWLTTNCSNVELFIGRRGTRSTKGEIR